MNALVTSFNKKIRLKDRLTLSTAYRILTSFNNNQILITILLRYSHNHVESNSLNSPV